MVQESPTKNVNTRRHKLESEMKRPQILGKNVLQAEVRQDAPGVL